MSTYVVADLNWTDPDARAEYGKRAREALARFGGQYLVAGGAPQPLEGEWRPAALAVIEFPSIERARSWYESDEYRPLRDLRFRGAITRAVIAEGVAGSSGLQNAPTPSTQRGDGTRSREFSREAQPDVTSIDPSTATRTVVEAFFQRLTAGEPEALTALLSHDIDWLIPGNAAVAPWLGRRSTRAGVAEYLRVLRASVQPIRADVHHVLVDGAIAVAFGEFASRMLATGRVVESIFFAQFEVRNGLIVRYRLLEDSQAVVEALTP